jgi:hypothetical protein
MNFDKDAFAHGPIESKIWLCNELSRFELKSVDRIYILGAWSGTMPFLLHAIKPVEYQQLVLVDVNQDYLDQARVICNAIDTAGHLHIINQDANTLAYSNDNILVINTSVDNIPGRSWWYNIPKGTPVVLQGRTGGHRDCVISHSDLEQFERAYPVQETFLLAEKVFTYPDHSYTRFMKIGIK